MGHICMPVIDMETLCFQLADVFRDMEWKKDLQGTPMTDEEIRIYLCGLLEKEPALLEIQVSQYWNLHPDWSQEDRDVLLHAIDVVGSGCTEIMGVLYGPDGTQRNNH